MTGTEPPAITHAGDITSVMDFGKLLDHGRWFRGQANSSWKLRPGILRRLNSHPEFAVLQAEREMNREFLRAERRGFLAANLFWHALSFVLE